MKEAIADMVQSGLLASLAEGEALERGGPEAQTADGTGVSTDSVRQIEALLVQLSEREYCVLQRLFGLDGAAPCRTDEVATALGLSEVQVGEIYERALSRLRAMPLAPDTMNGN